MVNDATMKIMMAEIVTLGHSEFYGNDVSPSENPSGKVCTPRAAQALPK
jgi:hypothetical protein